MTVEYDKLSFELIESYREIRTYLTIDKNIRTLLVTSAEMDEGKTTTVCNLAKCFSELEDMRVLLVDCDFRKRGVSRYLGIENTYGIADIVFGYKKPEECIKKVGEVDVITSGGAPSNSSMLLNSKTMKDVIHTFREQYDYVFIDSPPVSRLNDACIITQYVDGTIIVNASKAIDSKVAKISLEKLNKVGANILGVVLNKFKSEQYNYYNYYGYSDYDGKRPGLWPFGKKKKKKKNKK